MGLNLQFYDVADFESLDRLWEDATDWGEQSQALRRWFMEAPFGKPSVVVATDETTGKAVGQFRFMPARVLVAGREVSAVRPFGTIVTKEAHEAAAAQRPLDNPIWAMFFRGIDEFRARGAELCYIVPDERWIAFLKRATDVLTWANMKLGSFPLWSIPLPLTDGLLPLGEGFTASPLENWDGVDQLWEASRKLHHCMVMRDASVLRWKLSQASFTVTAVKRDGVLVGLVASREKGDRQWLICDLLAADDGPALRATLAAAVNTGHEEAVARAGGGSELNKIAVLATSVMEPVVRELGFVRDDYDFPLLVQALGKSFSVDDVKPERWYFSAND